MDFITDLHQGLKEQSAKMIASYEGDISARSLAEMETGLKQMTHELGNAIMQQWLEAQEQKYPDDEKECPRSGLLSPSLLWMVKLPSRVLSLG
jgi:hypothetical protein